MNENHDERGHFASGQDGAGSKLGRHQGAGETREMHRARMALPGSQAWRTEAVAQARARANSASANTKVRALLDKADQSMRAAKAFHESGARSLAKNEARLAAGFQKAALNIKINGR